MALTPGSDSLKGWLQPPVYIHLTLRAFHISNPDGVLKGEKPILEEKGPFSYKVRNPINLTCVGYNCTVKITVRFVNV